MITTKSSRFSLILHIKLHLDGCLFVIYGAFDMLLLSYYSPCGSSLPVWAPARFEGGGALYGAYGD